MSQLIFDEKPLKNHDFWIFVVAKNVKIVIFDSFLCKIWFSHFCPISFLLKKTMENHYFWIFWIPKNAKTLIFPCFFAKNGNFDESASWWSEKKIFRSGSAGPKNEFKTPLWHAAIKICGRLIRFLHFWWFHVFVFWFSEKSQKLHFQKMHFFQFFSSNFIKFAHFLLFFAFFVSKIPFFYRNFFDF